MPNRVSKVFHSAAILNSPGLPRGFTLIELMVTIIVAAILLALALPSFRELGIRMQVTESTNELIGDLNFARAEAVKRSGQVSLTSGGWSSGWNVVAADGTVLRSHAALPATYTLKASANGALVFNALGALQTPPSMNFAVCRPDNNAGQSKLIAVSGNGQVASHRDITASGMSCP